MKVTFQMAARLMLALVCLGLMSSTAFAQTTGTNIVTLVSDNITNASNVLIPLVVGIGVVLLLWGFARRIGSRAK